MKRKIVKKRKSLPNKDFYRFQLFFSGIATIVILLGFLVIFQMFQAIPFCANSLSCIQDLSGNYENGATQGVYMDKKVESPPPAIAQNFINTQVLGESTGPKRIDVDLTNQKLYAFEGEHLVYSYNVSTGKWHHTPTGTFTIWIKLRYTRMKGGDPAIGTYYNLPNVPYTMYLTNAEHSKSEGYGIHGAYWHNNFGHPMSHGCINLSPTDAGQLYSWADPPTTGSTTKATDQNPGTKVNIYGDTPVN